MNWTKTLVGILKYILSSPSERLRTSFQEHGTNSIYLFFATNIISFPKNLQLLYKYFKKVQN